MVSLIRCALIYFVLLTLLTAAGCGPTEKKSPAEQGSSDVPQLAPAEALPAATNEELTVSELRERLKANQNAVFEKRNGQIVMARLSNSGVTDLAPLKGLPLVQLELDGLDISDLSALQGMPLKNLYLTNTKVVDVSPLAGMQLDILWLEGSPISDLSSAREVNAVQFNLNGTMVTSIEPLAGKTFDTLWVPNTQVSDLTPLKDITLVSLDLENTPVTDLSPLSGHRELLRLNIAGVQVSDLSPLKDLNIERLVFTPELCRESWDVIKGMKSLQQIGTNLEQLQPPSEFWASVN